MDDRNNWISFGKIIDFYGISPSTGRRWIKCGKIKQQRKPSGHYFYFLPPEGIEKIQQSKSLKKIAYCRVSSSKQQDDLSRQCAFFESQYPDYQIVKDIGSGLNYKRKGLLKIMEQSNAGIIQEVLVSSKDRLCRFGFELIEWFFNQNNTKLVVLEREDKSPEQEFTEDILSILQVFACRWNGKRRYSVKNKENKNETKLNTEKNI
jgi:predicted site-specific integrase-resolvase